MKLYETLGLAVLAMTMTVGVTSAWPAISSTPDPSDWGVADGIVYAIVRSGDAVYLGGNFRNLVSASNPTKIPVSGLAAIDANTGQPLDWRPFANGTVLALAAAPDGSAIYAGGSFTSIDGVPRAHFAAIGLDGSLLWSADASDTVKCFAQSGDILYVGGAFARLLGQPRLRLAAIQPPSAGGVSPTLLAWAPGVTSTNGASTVVAGLAIGGPDVVAVGRFTHANNLPEVNQARFDALTGASKPWVNNITLAAKVIATDGTNFYGGFSGLGGRIVAWARNGNQLWQSAGNGDIQAITFCDGRVIAGGHFTMLQGLRVNRLAALWPDGTIDDKWNPSPNGGGDRGVWALHYHAKLYAGGGFRNVGTNTAHGFAQFSLENRPPPPEDLAATAVSPTQIDLSWTAPTSSEPVTGYAVYRNATRLAEVGLVSGYFDTTVSPSTSYAYFVRTRDSAGELGDPSKRLKVTTPPGTKAPDGGR